MPKFTATFTHEIERLKSTYRWLGFLAWLTVGHLGLLPVPNLPPQQWPHLPLGRIRQAAEVVGPWLLTVLKERQQRGLGWREATDAPVLAADLAALPFGPGELPRQPGWLPWRLEGELHHLLRLAEVPERLLPTGAGLPWEARYRALAVGLLRVSQLYVALEAQRGRDVAAEQLSSAAARVRQQATEVTPAAA